MLGLPLEQANIDLPELQEIDPHAIIAHKLEQARQHADGEYLIEDTSLYLHCLESKLPGPLIKWFEKTIGIPGIVTLTQKYQDTAAEAVTLFGYVDKEGQTHFFEGRLEGTIVQPRGDKDFGWGPIFQPVGMSKTFGEMDRDEKHSISMRGVALRKLKEFLS